MIRPRNAEKTRRSIVAAARQEFLHKGFAGARMDSIAREAGVTKQLIYHYFDSKEDIFDEVRREQGHDAVAAAQADANALPVDDPLSRPELLFVWRFQRALANLEWVRFVAWEAARGTEIGIPGQAERRRTIGRGVQAIEAAQDDGRLRDGLDPKLLQLAVFALANYPLAYAQITRLTTGRSPSSPRFREDWEAFLAELGQRVLAVNAPVAEHAKASQKAVESNESPRLARRPAARRGANSRETKK